MMGRTSLILVFVLILSGCRKAADDPRDQILKNATRVEVFRISPHDDEKPPPKGTVYSEKRIDGYLITAQGKDQGKEFADRLAAFLIDKRAHTKNAVKCFDPGVVFRVWKDSEAVDVVVCFHCGNLYYGPPTKNEPQENFIFRGSPLQPRLVQLAKEAFPDDKDIQALKEE